MSNVIMVQNMEDRQVITMNKYATISDILKAMDAETREDVTSLRTVRPPHTKGASYIFKTKSGKKASSFIINNQRVVVIKKEVSTTGW